MDKEELKKFEKEKIKKEKPVNKQASSASFQTNPILKEMLVTNINNKKNKFSIKDIFK